MKRVFIFVLVLSIWLTISSVSIASEKQKLAVMTLKATHGVEESLAAALSIVIRDEIHSYEKHEVLSRDDLLELAERTAIAQKVDCEASSQCLIDFGRAIGTKYMVAGTISKLGDTYTISMRFLDTEGDSAGVKRRVGEQCKCNEEDLIQTAKMVSALVIGEDSDYKAIKSQNGSVRIIGRDSGLIAYSDGTVLDTVTNLMWSANDNGNDVDVLGAKGFCERFEGGGYKDWRMPKQSELKTIYFDSDSGEHAINNLIKLTSPLVWLAKSDQWSSDYYYFSFNHNSNPSALLYKDGTSVLGMRALPVRDVKK